MTAGASALVLLVAIQAAGAQSAREVRLDAGAAQVQQTGRDAREAAGVFGISWRESSPLIATLLTGAITSAGDSASAAQASLAGAFRTSERTRWLTEGGISGAAFGSSLLSRGGSFSASARERLNFDAFGVWAGGAWGGTNRDDRGSHSTSLDLGGWYRAGEFEASATLSRVRTSDVPLLKSAGIFPADENEMSDLTDLATELRYEHGPLLLDATGTVRNGARTTVASQNAFYLTAIWTFSRRYSFAVGTGRLLADPVRGIPDMQLTTAAIRIALVPLKSPAALAAARGASYATVTQKSSGALLLVRVVVDDSAAVEVAGTFSNWTPVQLARVGDAWEAEIALPPGRHRVAVRINGGPWQAPRGTARIRDEYGGEAGLIVVP
jgi:hypothetical protein